MRPVFTAKDAVWYSSIVIAGLSALVCAVSSIIHFSTGASSAVVVDAIAAIVMATGSILAMAVDGTLKDRSELFIVESAPTLLCGITGTLGLLCLLGVPHMAGLFMWVALVVGVIIGIGTVFILILIHSKQFTAMIYEDTLRSGRDRYYD